MSNVLLMFLKALLNVLVAVQASFGGHAYGPNDYGPWYFAKYRDSLMDKHVYIGATNSASQCSKFREAAKAEGFEGGPFSFQACVRTRPDGSIVGINLSVPAADQWYELWIHSKGRARMLIGPFDNTAECEGFSHTRLYLVDSWTFQECILVPHQDF